MRELLQGTANLEFWETYENGEIAPLLDKANIVISQELYGKPEVKNDTLTNGSDTLKTKTPVTTTVVAKTDSTKTDTAAKAVSTGSVNAQDTAIKGFQKRAPLFSVFQNAFALVPLKGRITRCKR